MQHKNCNYATQNSKLDVFEPKEFDKMCFYLIRIFGIEIAKIKYGRPLNSIVKIDLEG